MEIKCGTVPCVLNNHNATKTQSIQLGTTQLHFHDIIRTKCTNSFLRYWHILHFIFPRVSVCKGSSSGYQTKTMQHKTKLATFVHTKRLYKCDGCCSIILVWFPDDGPLQTETCGNIKSVSKERVCPFCWFGVVNLSSVMHGMNNIRLDLC